ncbi:MAG: beta-galactosidase [Actinobacteria bacterium]|nr:beta-galactosidase [Actinomycetota bacterium]
MKTILSRRFPVALALSTCLSVAIMLIAASGCGAASPPTPPPPKGFFGIDPQSGLTERDAEYMQAGGIETVRWPLSWSAVQPTRTGGYDWSGFDQVVSTASRHGLQVLPVVLETPRWLSKGTKLPIDSATARLAWTQFLEAAVKRYGPGGEFWTTHAPGVVQYEPAIPTPVPIRNWQIWNEANFFYFAYPVSPQRYARLLKLSAPAIKRVDPGAKVIMSGLFGKPSPKGARGMPAVQFLEGVYRVPGIKSYFDGVALHPYAVDTETLEEMIEEFHEVTVKNHDRVPLYITEMGWGSQNDFNKVAFEQGIQGQVRELKGAYAYLLENRAKLNLKGVYWFAWKDLAGSCNFCDSVGLFRAGEKFKPKPAWRAFVGITRGSVRP